MKRISSTRPNISMKEKLKRENTDRKVLRSSVKAAGRSIVYQLNTDYQEDIQFIRIEAE